MPKQVIGAEPVALEQVGRQLDAVSIRFQPIPIGIDTHLKPYGKIIGGHIFVSGHQADTVGTILDAADVKPYLVVRKTLHNLGAVYAVVRRSASERSARARRPIIEIISVGHGVGALVGIGSPVGHDGPNGFQLISRAIFSPECRTCQRVGQELSVDLYHRMR